MRQPRPHIMILTGEPSGDFHAGPLINALTRLTPGLRVSGIGGPAMEAQGADIFFPIEKLSAMGLVQVLKQSGSIKQAFNRVKQRLRSDPPDLVVLIDYPGFNLKIAQHVKENTSIPVLYYIAPKVWAWNASRLKKIKLFTDHVALIFPFEQQIYKKKKIPATYVGNPLMDEYPHAVPGVETESSHEKPVIGLLPGSRSSEISNLLPVMLDTAEQISARYPKACFLISAASETQHQRIKGILSTHCCREQCRIIPGRPLSVFRRSHMLIAASGTVTLEAALCGLPTIIIYKLSALAFGLAKILVKVEFAGLANLIAEKEVMPELLQADANPDQICHKVFSMLEDLPGYRRKLDQVRERLGTPGAPVRAARIILTLIRKNRL